MNYIDRKLAFLFVIMKMVATLRSQGQNTINFAGLFKETQNSSIIEATINIVVSVIGVIYLGIYGVVIGSIVSSAYRGVYVTAYSNKAVLKLTGKEKSRKFLQWGLYFLLFLTIGFLTKNVIPDSVPNYFVWCRVGVIVFLSVVAIYFVGWLIVDPWSVKEIFAFLQSKLKLRKI